MNFDSWRYFGQFLVALILLGPGDSMHIDNRTYKCQVLIIFTTEESPVLVELIKCFWTVSALCVFERLFFVKDLCNRSLDLNIYIKLYT